MDQQEASNKMNRLKNDDTKNVIKIFQSGNCFDPEEIEKRIRQSKEIVEKEMMIILLRAGGFDEYLDAVQKITIMSN